MAADRHHPLQWQTGMFPATHRHLRLDVFAHHDADHYQATWNVWEGLDAVQIALTAQSYPRTPEGLLMVGQALSVELGILGEGLRSWEG